MELTFNKFFFRLAQLFLIALCVGAVLCSTTQDQPPPLLKTGAIGGKTGYLNDGLGAQMSDTQTQDQKPPLLKQEAIGGKTGYLNDGLGAQMGAQ